MVWTTSLAGISLAGAQFHRSLTWLLFALSLIHGASMFLNHGFGQRNASIISKAEISPFRLIMRAYFILAAGVFIIMIKTDYAFQPMIAVILLSCVVVYHNWQHRTGRFAPIIGAFSPVLMFLVSAAAIGSAVGSEVIIGAAVLFGYLIGLAYIGEIDGFIKVGKLWPLAFLAFPLIYLCREANLLAGMALVGWEIYSLSFFIGGHDRKHEVMINLVVGIALVNATLISAIPNHLNTAFVCFVAFTVSLGLRRILRHWSEEPSL